MRKDGTQRFSQETRRQLGFFSFCIHLAPGEGQRPVSLAFLSISPSLDEKARALKLGQSSFKFLEKAMAPYSSTFAWKIPWTEEPGRLQSMGSLKSDMTE